MELSKKLQRKLNNQVLESEPLKKHTTFQIGGPAKYYYRARSSGDLAKAVKASLVLNTDYFILGGGSNILVSDKGFLGLVIDVKNNKVEIKGHELMAEAGAALGYVGLKAKVAGLTGFEFASVIPGSVGGAIRGNAGAFGQEIKDILKEAEVMDEKGKIKTMMNSELKFSYRNSLIKNSHKVVLKGIFELKKSTVKEVESKIKEYQKYKRETQALEYPSAGCIFKNPPGKSAGEMIEELGLKGYKVGGAMVSNKHANFIVNMGKAKAEDVVILIGIIKQKVRTHYQGLRLEEEIQYVGF